MKCYLKTKNCCLKTQTKNPLPHLPLPIKANRESVSPYQKKKKKKRKKEYESVSHLLCTKIQYSFKLKERAHYNRHVFFHIKL